MAFVVAEIILHGLGLVTALTRFGLVLNLRNQATCSSTITLVQPSSNATNKIPLL